MYRNPMIAVESVGNLDFIIPGQHFPAALAEPGLKTSVSFGQSRCIIGDRDNRGVFLCFDCARFSFPSLSMGIQVMGTISVILKLKRVVHCTRIDRRMRVCRFVCLCGFLSEHSETRFLSLSGEDDVCWG